MDAVADRVKETTTSPGGTGDITLAGAASGFQSFNTAFGTNKYFYYTIVQGNDWEVGQGYLSTSTNLKRNVVYKSSNSNAAINLTNGVSADVFCSAIGELFSDLTGKILGLAKSAPMP